MPDPIPDEALLKRVQSLVDRARDPAGNTNERIASAAIALKYMHQHTLTFLYQQVELERQFDQRLAAYSVVTPGETEDARRQRALDVICTGVAASPGDRPIVVPYARREHARSSVAAGESPTEGLDDDVMAAGAMGMLFGVLGRVLHTVLTNVSTPSGRTVDDVRSNVRQHVDGIEADFQSLLRELRGTSRRQPKPQPQQAPKAEPAKAPRAKREAPKPQSKRASSARAGKKVAPKGAKGGKRATRRLRS
jgi:hypothetical protein